jgi:hypothetical protein
MKNISAFLVFLLLGLSSARSEVRLTSPLLRVTTVTDKSTAIEFCDIGECKALGRTTGYTTDQWKEIRTICESNANYGSSARQALKFTLSAASLYIGSAVGTPLAMLMAGAASHLAGGTEIDATGARVASDLMEGALDGKQTFILDLDTFVALRNGIRDCALRYEQRDRERRFFRQCRNLLNRSECRFTERDESGPLEL